MRLRSCKCCNAGMSRPVGTALRTDFAFRATNTRFQGDSSICGTREFIAPEIWEYKKQSSHGSEDGPYKAASDVYSLGMTFFEILTHKRPFSGLWEGGDMVERCCDHAWHCLSFDSWPVNILAVLGRVLFGTISLSPASIVAVAWAAAPGTNPRTFCPVLLIQLTLFSPLLSRN